MSSVRSDSSRSSSTWLTEIAVRACPSSQFCQPFKVATHPTDRRAGLHLSRLRHQLRRSSPGDLARVQPTRRHGKPHCRVEARPRRRWLLLETVLRHRGRLSRRITAVQPAGRVPTCGGPAGLSPAGYDPDSGPHLRRCSRSSWSPSGDPSVGKLGWTQDQNPAARQHLELANSNFAEVGAGARNLIPYGAKPSFPKP